MPVAIKATAKIFFRIFTLSLSASLIPKGTEKREIIPIDKKEGI